MGSAIARTGGLLIGVASLLAVSGCTISFHPMSAFSMPNSHPPAPVNPNPPPPGPLDPNLPPPIPYPGVNRSNYGPNQGPGQGPNPNLPPNSDVAMAWRQRLMASEEERKVLLDRIQEIEGQLQEKNVAVRQANFEVQDSIKQIRRTRDDITRWKQEMDDLRTKIRSMEVENKATLETIVKTLERYVEPPLR